MKIVVASSLIVPRSTRFISLSRARALIVPVLIAVWSLTSATFAQQAPPNAGAPGGGFGYGNPPQGAPGGNMPSTPGASGNSSATNVQSQGGGQNAQNSQNGQNAQNNSTNSQGASTHGVNIAGDQIAPFFQISTNANSPIVGEQLTILRLVYGINSPAERSRRLVAYWELSGRHAYYNLCSVYLDFVNQCSQKVESAYSSGMSQETTTLLNSLRLIAAQRCEDARLNFLQAQYDFDAAFTSAAGRRAAIARAEYESGNSKAIGWGSAVLYIPSAKPATDFYNSRFEENSRWRVASKEAARLNALLPLLYESLQSRANQAIREKDVLIGAFNASSVSETAIFNALDRYFEAQRDTIEAAIKYNEAIALYVAETTPGYVQGERFLATLNQRAENASQNARQGETQNAPAGNGTNDAQAPKNAPTRNTSAGYAPRSLRQILPGFEYETPTPERSYTAIYRAAGMERWYFPGFDDEETSTPQTFASDPVVDSVSNSRIGGNDGTPEQPLVAPLASSSVSSSTTEGALGTSSLGAVDLQPAVYSKPESTSPGDSQKTEEKPESTNAQPSSPSPNVPASSDFGAQPSAPAPSYPGAQPPVPAPADFGAQPPVPVPSDSGTQPPTPVPGESPASENSGEGTQESEKPHVFASSKETNAHVGDDEILAFFQKFHKERLFSARNSNVDSFRIVRGQAPDAGVKGNGKGGERQAENSQNRAVELARALFAPTTPEQESGKVVERTCSLAEILMRVPNSPNARFDAVDAYWKLQRASARFRVEALFLSSYTRAFNDANAASSESARVCLAAALGAQARVAEAKSAKRSAQVELLRVSNQSVDYGYPIPSTLPFLGTSYELGTPIPENLHTRRSGELIRSRLQGIQKLSASIPAATAAFSLDVESVANCDILVALETLEKKRESVLLFIDSVIDLNESIAEYVSFFPASASNEQFVEALVGRN